jgi:PIN domain
MGKESRQMKSMQGHGTADPPKAVIDACVWHASFLRDLIVHAAVTGAVAPIWTPTIEAEWTRSVLRRRPEISSLRIQSVADRIRLVVPSGCIPTPSVRRIPKQLRSRFPDPSDLHVVTAAIAAVTTWRSESEQRRPTN